MAGPAAKVAASPAPASLAASGAQGGVFSEHTWPPNGGQGSRHYWVFVPSTAASSGPIPLVVYLHGCNQTAPDAALGTRWNELAARRGFAVAYPEQRLDQSVQQSDGNGVRCWNWFRPDDQVRGSGEPATIVGITSAVVASENIDPHRVWVLGSSAGADMAVVLGATYPDVFAAIGAVAGCPYRTCSDGSGLAAYAAMGPNRAREMPVFAVQGSADPVNSPALGAALVRQWLGTDHLADDGEIDGSVSSVPASVESHGFEPQRLVGGLGHPGDVCVRPSQLPCPGGALGFRGSYPYTVEHYLDRAGNDMVDSWVVQGLSHDYPGGDPRGSFTDPLGPDITEAAYDFFSA
ncbi:MAG: extracellular catalytic domain type 1 short-chain-length polyhydroxyalkanoate depolymerase, partial [Acidimicrobiales bacterium]